MTSKIIVEMFDRTCIKVNVYIILTRNLNKKMNLNKASIAFFHFYGCVQPFKNEEHTKMFMHPISPFVPLIDKTGSALLSRVNIPTLFNDIGCLPS